VLELTAGIIGLGFQLGMAECSVVGPNNSFSTKSLRPILARLVSCNDKLVKPSMELAGLSRN
jgi:hypothetical protein